ncbi:MAG: ABC transporter permease [Euryarchaeota archaeon]|nr:ABC transporter permease [Euryarchaeota archaeon]MDE1836100.1 ABC transporter permease [Euryarchaeota archaeon]MDE1879390.1 ABC transporter permease [Euryarchaeota archaeon]MDE2044078.1 ABC transporter permease [Thermoplasmata archaeon]
MKLWVFLLRRLLLMIPVLIGVVTITFIIISAVPVSQRIAACIPPPRGGYPPPGTPQYANELRICGLDQTPPVQYGRYLYHTFTGQWGYVSNDSGMVQASNSPVKPCFSMNISQQQGGCTVMTLVSNWLPYTIELAAISLVLILAIAIPLGNKSAVHRNRPLDQGTRVFSFSGFALPSFLLGALIILVLYSALTVSNPYDQNNAFACENSAYEQIVGSWPPALSQCYYQHFSNGTSNLMPPGQPHFTNPLWGTQPTGLPTLDGVIFAASHAPAPGMPGGKYYYWDLVGDHFLRLLIPALTIAYGSVATLLRFVRNSMLEVMNLDFIRTARAKGVPERQVVKHHAGRNSLNVTVTILGLTFAAFLGGFAVTETLFGLFGVGSMFAYSVLPPPDISTIFASTVLFTIIIVVANVIVDVVYGILDPRVRLG